MGIGAALSVEWSWGGENPLGSAPTEPSTVHTTQSTAVTFVRNLTLSIIQMSSPATPTDALVSSELQLYAMI